MNRLQNAAIVRDDGFDKFYTIPSIVSQCISQLSGLYSWDTWDLVIEPSAGNGNFLSQIPTSKKIGLDILPEHADIVKCDYFTYNPPSNARNILVVGNPPFGRVSSMAIKFFNYAAKTANVVAFIVPRTFRRVSVQNKLDLQFHLVFDEELPVKPCCFEPPMMAKCCFQIWEKKREARSIVKLPTSHPDWEFLPFGPSDAYGQPTPPETAEFAIRAYGGKCGEIKTVGLSELRPKSWHWIKCNIDMTTLIQRFKQLDYSNSLNTARQNSIGRGEMVLLYGDFINAKIQ